MLHFVVNKNLEFCFCCHILILAMTKIVFFSSSITVKNECGHQYSTQVLIAKL